jgi:predicted transcriptional regulator
MSHPFDTVFDLNRHIYAALDEREQDVVRREREANKILLECDLEREKIKSEREAIKAAEKLQRHHLEALGVIVPDSFPHGDSVSESALTVEGQEAKKRRARVGPQRYAILTSLRLWGEANIDEIVSLTDLSIKRIKDQFRVDIPEGIVRLLSNNKYELTAEGEELLARFEEYKTRQGEPLPTLADADGDAAAEADEESEA